MVVVDHQIRYNLRSKKNYDNSNLVSQPKKNKDTVKIPIEKQVAKPSKLEVANPPSLEVKIAHKLSPTFNFKNEIQNIKILVPLVEHMKNDDLKNTFMKALQPPPTEVTFDFF